MVELVNSLLNVSRIDLGTFPIESKIININELAQEVINTFKEDLKLKQIEVQENFSHDLPEIEADPKIITIILQNLLSNAIKYTPSSGIIKITLKKEFDNI
jgi:cell cycle sensor histidine kinase DivJ